jgi:hypothetical protein
MNDAYSIFLSSYYKAQEIDYENIAQLQMVCPCCREPVFKVARQSETGSIAYFSHHKVQAAISAECERRVAGLSVEQKEAVNAASRGQSLALFRSVVTGALKKIPIHERIYEPSSGGPSRKWAQKVAVLLRVLVRENDLENVVGYTDKIRQGWGSTSETKFERSYRTQIAADLMRTLVTEHSSRSFNYILDRAIVKCHQPGLIGKQLTESAAATMFSFEGLNGLVKKLPGAKAKGYAQEYYDDTNYIFLYIDTMMRELHQLPYFKIIANVKAGKDPLDGITYDDYALDKGARMQTEDEIKVNYPGILK